MTPIFKREKDKQRLPVIAQKAPPVWSESPRRTNALDGIWKLMIFQHTNKLASKCSNQQRTKKHTLPKI